MATELRVDADWPVHTRELRSWRPASRPSRREDRLFSEVEVTIPPRIASLAYAPAAATAVAIESAAVAITRLDAVHGPLLSSFATFLLRTEAIASSRIEDHDPRLADFAKATLGLRAGRDAQLAVAASRAVARLVEAAGRRGRLELDDLLAAHAVLLGDDPAEGHLAGALRNVQNWIGGAASTPRDALYVPPPPDAVPGLVDDLLAFANRDDVPAVAQAAIVHAQFEAIHPFTDGNGRIGRALIGAVWRRRGLAPRLVVPVASAMLADTSVYFDRVNAYRDGYAGQFVEYVAECARRAAAEAEASAARLAALPEVWRAEVRVRAGSAASALLDALLDDPVLDADLAARITGASDAATYDALARLTEAGVLRKLNSSARRGVWAADDVVGEIDALTDRLRRRARVGTIGGSPQDRVGTPEPKET